MKKSKQSQNCWQRWVCPTSIFEKKRARWPTVVINLLNSALTFMQYKKIYRKLKKTT